MLVYIAFECNITVCIQINIEKSEMRTFFLGLVVSNELLCLLFSMYNGYCGFTQLGKMLSKVPWDATFVFERKTNIYLLSHML